MSSSLLDRRQSYERIPRFFFPQLETDCTTSQSATKLCQQRVLNHINDIVLTTTELKHILNGISSLASIPELSTFQRILFQKTVKHSKIVLINRLLADGMILQLSYQEYSHIIHSSNSETIQKVLSPQVFLMLPSNEEGYINGYTLLEYVLQYHTLMITTKLLWEQKMIIIDGTMKEEDVIVMLQDMIQSANDHHLDIEPDFYEYYELICIRMILIRHSVRSGTTSNVVAIDDLHACPVFLEFMQLMDKNLHMHFVAENDTKSIFHPESIRFIHRQYLQLDYDHNGMISMNELMEYGKKKAFNPYAQTPTHDLSRVFVDHVFMEAKTYSSTTDDSCEIDYKSFIDFTLIMADKISHASLRFFWNVLDFQKQGYLDAFTLDYFLRGLVDKIHEHDIDSHVTIARLRTQVFDLVAPVDPLRITWKDLVKCHLGHLVVRMLTDYVAYREYEECDGRFILSS